MNNTQYLNSPAPYHLAQGYADLYNNNRLVNLTDLNICGTGNGFSGMYSTVEDLSKFMDALMIKKTLLKESTLNEILHFTRDSEENAVAFGLGIWKDFMDEGENQFAYGHRGREAGYSTDLFWFPNQDIMYVLMLNCGVETNARIKKKFMQFRKDLVKELLNNPINEETETVLVSTDNSTASSK